MNILKFKSVSSENTTVQPEGSPWPIGTTLSEIVPGLYFIINPGKSEVLSAFDAYPENDALYIQLKNNAYNQRFDLEYDNDEIESIEDSNELTSALLKLLYSKPGGGIVEVTNDPAFVKYNVRFENYPEIYVDPIFIEWWFDL